MTMRVTLSFAAALILITSAAAVGNINNTATEMAGVFDFTMKSLDGESVDLERYRGTVVLIVNVASECGYTYQYEGLQNLHEKYADQGWRSWDSLPTISAVKNRVRQPRSRISANGTSGWNSTCSPKSSSGARTRSRCTPT